MFAARLLVTALAATVAQAVQHNITVGGNTTANASLIFSPQEVHAQKGDVVTFVFVNGSYDVIQSQFDEPCIPASVFTPGFNGFDSGPRPTANGSAVTFLNVSITDNTTAIWFYENSTCAQGGVGVINANDSSTETLAGFSRNAIRLNGTNATSTSSGAFPSATGPSNSSGTGGPSGTGSGSSGTGSSSAAGASNTSSPAERVAVAGTLLAMPFAVLALLL
ncbi:hypothetical protein EIP86_003830 [Pleurotus ostreatoroseus]|nr:hypothetical protein EIP86_003830 [Pleurotus ostreatoroseus]